MAKLAGALEDSWEDAVGLLAVRPDVPCGIPLAVP
jgi:hypothetical protein